MIPQRMGWRLGFAPSTMRSMIGILRYRREWSFGRNTIILLSLKNYSIYNRRIDKMIKDLQKIFDVIKKEKPLIDSAIAEINSNVMDINTHPTNKRRLTLNFLITPNSERTSGSIELEVKNTLARRVSEETEVAFGSDQNPPLSPAKEE
jgi:hypothetical protein